MLARWRNDFGRIERMFDRFDSMFDNMFNHSTTFNAPFASMLGIENKRDEDGSLSVTVDVPGIKEEDISVELSPDGIVTVKGERKTNTSSHSLCKTFSLPEDVDVDSLKANLDNGVLTIALAPKVLPPPKEVKKIPVLSKK